MRASAAAGLHFREPLVEGGAALRAAALLRRRVLAQTHEHARVRVRLHAAEMRHQLLDAPPQRIRLQLRARAGE